MSVEGFRPSPQALAFLFTGEGERLLADLAASGLDESNQLRHTLRLRASFSPDVVAAAVEITLLRHRAQAKFARAERMFFTRQALEQATAEIVARHHAARFAPYPVVADLGCAAGGDAIALADRSRVAAIDLDDLLLQMLRANAAAYEVPGRVAPVHADAAQPPLANGLPFWADPSRRKEGRRSFSVEGYQPPLSALRRLAAAAPAAGIKLSPGVDYAELGGVLGALPHELEFISVRGECREAVLWLGALITVQRRATLLPSGATLASQDRPGPPPVGAPGQVLYEPDAAVIRAHLVQELACQLGAAKLDEEVAYLTADTVTPTPFADAYWIDEVLPFELKRLNRRLQAADVGELIIKKRAFAVDPEQFRRRLKYGGGTRRVVLVLTRIRGKPVALLCRPLAS
jgi:hypothetical protein